MNLGQIIFPATGSWAQSIVDENNSHFVINDRYTSEMEHIPKCDCVKDERRYDAKWISNFDPSNTGPTYIYAKAPYKWRFK